MDKTANREFLQAQLTIGRWYIDRASDSRGDVRRRYLSLARETCELIERLSPTLNLDVEARHEAARTLIVLRGHLDAVGDTR
ncbi:MAG TPA: hypothetical protein VFN79_17840 [Steroidobacteraceae bacterium]|nr:hypothetical protein [Steroidobacteraceae bacterium]